MKKLPVQFGMLMGAMAAAIVVVGWFLIAVIKWDFSVSALGLRLLFVVSFVAGSVGYIAEKWFT